MMLTLSIASCVLAVATFALALRCAQLTLGMRKHLENMNRRIYNIELEQQKQPLR